MPAQPHPFATRQYRLHQKIQEAGQHLLQGQRVDKKICLRRSGRTLKRNSSGPHKMLLYPDPHSTLQTLLRFTHNGPEPMFFSQINIESPFPRPKQPARNRLPWRKAPHHLQRLSGDHHRDCKVHHGKTRSISCCSPKRDQSHRSN